MSKFLLILLILASPNTFAAVSKWVDDQGQVHYSDQPPPPDAKAEKLRATPDAEATTNTGGAASTSEPTGQKTLAEREAELKKAQQAKQEAAEKAAQKQAAADALKVNCANAQEDVRGLQSGIRLVKINANGESVYIDDTERQQRLEKAQKDVSNFCK